MQLIVFKGMPGSGKSTVARALSHRRGYPLIDKDDIKDVIDGHADDAGRLAYETMWNLARRQLLQGLSVICDSPLTFPGLYERARRIAAETQSTLVVIECQCRDESVLRARIEARQTLGLPSHHQTNWDSYCVYRDRVQVTSAYRITDSHLVVDTTQPLEAIMDEINRWLPDR